MQISDIIRLKYPKVDFTKDVILQDDGNGPYIKEWNLGIHPSEKDLQEWMEDPDILNIYDKQKKNELNAPIIAQLELLDLKSIRALRAKDTEKLTDLENQAIELRKQLIK